MTTHVRPLLPADETEAMQAERELAADGFSFLLDWHGQDWATYLADLEAIRRGEVAEGRVPATFLVAHDVDSTLVGRVSVRHHLNDALAHVGGHVGYGVRPAHRRRGHATAMLRAGLDVARGAGVAAALVTCDEGNLASATTIERCGGVLESVVEDHDGRPSRRYWIDTGLDPGRSSGPPPRDLGPESPSEP